MKKTTQNAHYSEAVTTIGLAIIFLSVVMSLSWLFIMGNS
jgi:hypothetical protein